jgi:hypothetical protein
VANLIGCPDGVVDIVNGQDEYLGLVEVGGPQQVQIAGIAVIYMLLPKRRTKSTCRASPSSAVNPILCVRSTRATIWPKRPKPAMTTGLS